MGTLIRLKGKIALVGTPDVGIEYCVAREGEGVLLSGPAVGSAVARLELKQDDEVEVQIIKPDKG